MASTLARYAKPLAPRSAALAPDPGSAEGQDRAEARRVRLAQARDAAAKCLAMDAQVARSWLQRLDQQVQQGRLTQAEADDVRMLVAPGTTERWQRVQERTPDTTSRAGVQAPAAVNEAYWRLFGDAIRQKVAQVTERCPELAL